MRVELPWPPSSLSGHTDGKGRWAKIHATKRLRADAEILTRAAGRVALPEAGDIAIVIRFEPPNNRGDRYNFPARAKPLVDGVADALGVNDSRFLPHFEYGPTFKGGRVVVTIGGGE